jgi:tetratricopeptide (TPR) repeat protein
VPERVKVQRDLLNGKLADKAAKDLPDLKKMDNADLYAAACELISDLQYRKALILLDELTVREASHFMAWYYKGACCDLLGFDERAIRAWTVCIALKPEFPNCYVNRARSEMRRGEAQNAVIDLDRALSLDASLTSALIDRAVAKRDIHDLAGAESDLTKALSCDDAPTRAYFIRASVRRALDRKADADRDMVEGLKHDPRDELDYTQRGFARLHTEPAAALEDFDKALSLNPRHRPALLNKAYLLGDVLGKNEEAIAVVNEMLRIHPYDLNALAGRGVYYARLGRVKEARADGEECLKFCRDAQGYFHLACLYSLLSPHDSQARDESIRLLTLALRNGMCRPQQVAKDKDFDPLRKDAEFCRLAELAESLGKAK